jgi:hypothetical protein
MCAAQTGAGHMTCARPQAESQNPLTRGRRPHMTHSIDTFRQALKRRYAKCVFQIEDIAKNKWVFVEVLPKTTSVRRDLVW